MLWTIHLTLHQPSGYFALGDPHCHLLSTEYNSLHDLQSWAYYKCKDNLQTLKRGGYFTSDGKVGWTSECFSHSALRQTRSGNSHTCSSKAVPCSLSTGIAAGGWPGSRVRSTAPPGWVGAKAPAAGEGRVCRGAALAGLLLFLGRQAT